MLSGSALDAIQYMLQMVPDSRPTHGELAALDPFPQADSPEDHFADVVRSALEEVRVLGGLSLLSPVVNADLGVFVLIAGTAIRFS